ncbi:unnamed protein product [Cuscuta campestris]|uniref:Uncharacterized protein n=1 Tax=Cuscuta campestris TaxID=132261 RepID=A0A484M6G4_9ASTE|nr:unnamed protein product [Cuscuta campestris]
MISRVRTPVLLEGGSWPHSVYFETPCRISLLEIISLPCQIYGDWFKGGQFFLFVVPSPVLKLEWDPPPYMAYKVVAGSHDVRRNKLYDRQLLLHMSGLQFTIHNDDGSDGDVDPKEMLIIVEEKFQESLRVNKKKYLENDSLKCELDEFKRDVEQLTKELQRCKAEELAILQRKWVELLQANKKTVLKNHQLVAKRNRLKEGISELEKKIEEQKGKQSDLKYELNQLKNFHQWMRSAGAKAIEEQVNISKFCGDKTGLVFSASESNKTPLDLFVDQRNEVSQKAPQRRKLETAKSAGKGKEL